MEEGKKNIKKRLIIFSVLAVCLFLLLVGWCRQYALQNQEMQEKVVELQGEVEELTATLEDRNKAIEIDGKEIEDLRTLLAETEQSLQKKVRQTLYEYETETGFVKKNGVDCKFRGRKLYESSFRHNNYLLGGKSGGMLGTGGEAGKISQLWYPAGCL